MFSSAQKPVLFFLKLLTAILFIFSLAVLQHGIGVVNNKVFNTRIQKAKDTIFIIAFFKSWNMEEQQAFSALRNENLENLRRPVILYFISLDDQKKIFYSTIPYMITQGIGKNGFFIDNNKIAGSGFSLIDSRKSPGNWVVFYDEQGVLKIKKLTIGIKILINGK